MQKKRLIALAVAAGLVGIFFGSWLCRALPGGRFLSADSGRQRAARAVAKTGPENQAHVPSGLAAAKQTPTDPPGPTEIGGTIDPAGTLLGEGAVGSTLSTNVVTTSGNPTVTLATGGSIQDFANGQNVVIKHAGLATSLTAPSGMTVTPMSFDANDKPVSGCKVDSTIGSMAAGSAILFTPNTTLFGVGDMPTVAGAGLLPGTAVAQVFTTGWEYVLTNTATATVDHAAVGGFSCGTTYTYQVVAIDDKDGRSAPTAPVSTSVGPLHPNWTNYINVTVNTVSGANAYALYGCRGAACTPKLMAVETPNYTANAGGDPLLGSAPPSGGKVTPSTITFHEVGLPYGTDIAAVGTNVPGGAINDDLDTSITPMGISGSNITLVTAPSVTSGAGGLLMFHDDTVAFNNVFKTACPSTGKKDVTLTAGTYTVAQTIGSKGTDCAGLHFHGIGAGLNRIASLPAIEWVGALGGTVVDFRGLRSAVVEGLGIRSQQVTPGVGVDYDNGSGGAGATRVTFRNIDITEAGIALRLCNTSFNCDFTTLDNVGAGFADPTTQTAVSGSYGYYINASSALSIDVDRGQMNAQIGAFHIGGPGGGGNISFDHVNFGSISGTIGFWLRYRLPTAMLFRDGQQEFGARYFYTPDDDPGINVVMIGTRASNQIFLNGDQYRIGSGRLTAINARTNTATTAPATAQGGNLPPVFANGNGLVTSEGSAWYSTVLSTAGTINELGGDIGFSSDGLSHTLNNLVTGNLTVNGSCTGCTPGGATANGGTWSDYISATDFCTSCNFGAMQKAGMITLDAAIARATGRLNCVTPIQVAIANNSNGTQYAHVTISSTVNAISNFTIDTSNCGPGCVPANTCCLPANTLLTYQVTQGTCPTAPALHLSAMFH